jgi:hypothetical protein
MINFYSVGEVQRLLSSELKVETAAFNAVKDKAGWVVKLDPHHFPEQVKSVAVTYNDTFYGVFLLSDKIYLPALLNAELILSLLDTEGTPITTEVFTLGESDEKQLPAIP